MPSLRMLDRLGTVACSAPRTRMAPDKHGPSRLRNRAVSVRGQPVRHAGARLAMQRRGEPSELPKVAAAMLQANSRLIP
jgi:hypothetical protein